MGNEATVETFDRLMAVNARGTMLCYKHAGKQMIAQGRGGRIIGAFLRSPPHFLSGTDEYFQGLVHWQENRVISSLCVVSRRGSPRTNRHGR
jgi:hypothetical protein